MTELTDKEIIESLGKALQAASDHLEYCGYGDAWERECSISQDLPDKIENALKLVGRSVD